MGFSFLKGCLSAKVDPVIDAILNETIVSEIEYFAKLNAFQRHYGDLLLDIASGRHGKERQLQLRLNKAEIELLCGTTLRGVIDCSEDLIEALRAFNTKGGRPRTQAGRVWMMIGIFNDFLERISDSYCSYVRSHKERLQMLQKREDEIMSSTPSLAKSSSSRLKLLKISRKNLKNKVQKHKNDYLTLWELASTEQHHLTGARIDSILIMPVQRTFQTKMRFERLLKHAGDRYPQPVYYDELEKLINQLESIAHRLNKCI
mmetsp:Transcript_7627/g.10006  ORF Transcript_7627/g.10006 Transcript_7627/m.10006 type:complete len:260 (-) Transcript_7627:330-1109(-)